MRGVARGMIGGGQERGEKLGVEWAIGGGGRIDGGAAGGARGGSMLRGLDQGRPMEIDALVGSVQELGRVVGVPTPTIDTVLALVQLRAKAAGLY